MGSDECVAVPETVNQLFQALYAQLSPLSADRLCLASIITLPIIGAVVIIYSAPGHNNIYYYLSKHVMGIVKCGNSRVALVFARLLGGDGERGKMTR